jgi:osmotically-inducible protein OsmY
VHDQVVLQPTVLPSEVKKKINAALLRNAQLDSNRIDVIVEPGGLVTLRGAVLSWAECRQVEKAARSTPGVTTVVNELRIGT